MDEITPLSRKKGRIASGIQTAQYTVMLESEPAEWGKRQPGGLSELMRKLLRESYERASSNK